MICISRISATNFPPYSAAFVRRRISSFCSVNSRRKKQLRAVFATPNIFPGAFTKLFFMLTILCMLLIGLAYSCISLPNIAYVNDRPYHLMQSTECRGGKIYEISQVQDIDECKAACLYRNCRAVNLFQVGEFQFKCEILAYVHGYIPAQGAACYLSYN